MESFLAFIFFILCCYAIYYGMSELFESFCKLLTEIEEDSVEEIIVEDDVIGM